MNYTTRQLESMLEALSESILELERDYNNTSEDRARILWRIQQLSENEKLLLKMVEFNEITNQHG